MKTFTALFLHILIKTSHVSRTLCVETRTIKAKKTTRVEFLCIFVYWFCVLQKYNNQSNLYCMTQTALTELL